MGERKSLPSRSMQGGNCIHWERKESGYETPSQLAECLPKQGQGPSVALQGEGEGAKLLFASSRTWQGGGVTGRTA